jgi:tRNA(fMet)-specific endonuclease VapC
LDALLELIPPVAFDRPAAAVYAEVRAAAPDRRRDALDKLIASHAKSLNLTLVTNNLEDFRVYPDIALENWVEEN